MPKSPKKVRPTTDTGNPPSIHPIPTKKSRKEKSRKEKSPKKEKKVSTSAEGEGETDEYEYYLDEFKKITNELPTVDGTDYNTEQFGDDVVCIIDDFKKTCDIVIRPDVDTMIDISNKKITNKKDRNNFIFGADDGSQISIHDKIKNYTDGYTKNFLSELEKKYKNS